MSKKILRVENMTTSRDVCTGHVDTGVFDIRVSISQLWKANIKKIIAY
uniref:Uncharacterized protein n=1 Tax=Arundo donax TaxID=35708 RepID=A0A0A9BLW3_ARUDO